MAYDHKSGDMIQGSWVCAHCYQSLGDRPKRYKMGFYDGSPRQEIDWQAEFAIGDGVPFRVFMGWMVRYLQMRCAFTIPKDEALSQCLEALKDMGEPYGDDGCSWDKSDAKDIVNEAICAYWDEAPSGANS